MSSEIWTIRRQSVHSIAVFESEEAYSSAAEAVNAQPLLLGQDPAGLPGPDRGQTVEVFQVLDVLFPEDARG